MIAEVGEAASVSVGMNVVVTVGEAVKTYRRTYPVDWVDWQESERSAPPAHSNQKLSGR